VQVGNSRNSGKFERFVTQKRSPPLRAPTVKGGGVGVGKVCDLLCPALFELWGGDAGSHWWRVSTGHSEHGISPTVSVVIVIF